MKQYKLEWMFKNGKTFCCWEDTLEEAEQRAKEHIDNDDIMLMCISKCELIKVLKGVYDEN